LKNNTKHKFWLNFQSKFYKYLLLIVGITLIGFVSGCKIFKRHSNPENEMPMKYGVPPSTYIQMSDTNQINK